MINIKFSKRWAPEQVRISVNGLPFEPDYNSRIKYHLFCGEIKKGFDGIKRQYRKELKKAKTFYAFIIKYSDNSASCLNNSLFNLYDHAAALRYYKATRKEFKKDKTAYIVESGELGKATTKKEVKVYPVSIQLARFVDAGNAYYLACKTNPYYR